MYLCIKLTKIWRSRMARWAAIIFLFFSLCNEECVAAGSVDLVPWLNELSAQNLADLVNMSDPNYKRSQNQGTGLKYRHIDPKEILRWNQQDETEKNQHIYNEIKKMNPSSITVPKACYTIQSTWRRARIDMLRYFSLREYYENTHTFEIGYLTHVIVSKYMNTLELYDMVAYRFLEHPMKNYAPSSWVWFIYINILDYTRHIIQWCNMMHEIMAKYGLASGTSKDGPDYETLSTPDPEEMEIDKYAKNIHENYLAELAARKKKQLESRLRYKYGIRKPSMNLTTTKTKRPPQFWKWRTGTAGFGKDYGWSKEKFFTNY